MVLLMPVLLTNSRNLRWAIASIVLLVIQSLVLTSLFIFINKPDLNMIFDQLTFSRLDYLKLFLIMVGSIGVTISAVDRQRHSEQATHGDSYFRFLNLFTGLFRKKGSFSTRGQAYYWGVVRGVGMSMMLTALIIPIAIVGLTLMFMRTLCEPIFQYPMIITGQILLLSILFVKSLNQAGFSLPAFDATRAMDNAELLQGKLTAFVSCALPIWSCMALAAWVGTHYFGAPSFLNRSVTCIQPFLAEASLWDWIGIALVLSTLLFMLLALLVSETALFALRSNKALSMLSGVILIYPWLMTWDAHHHWILLPFWRLNACMLAGTVVLMTSRLWQHAFRENYLQLHHLLKTLAFWSIYTVVVIVLYRNWVSPDQIYSFYMLTMGVCLLCIPLATFPAAVIATGQLRHQ